METKSKGKGQKMLILLLMIISMCTIYVLPYLRYQFFTLAAGGNGTGWRDTEIWKSGNCLRCYEYPDVSSGRNYCGSL